jgi:hypothetical protein
MVSLTLRPLYYLEKSFRYPLDIKLVGPQIRFERCVKDAVSCPYRESKAHFLLAPPMA